MKLRDRLEIRALVNLIISVIERLVNILIKIIPNSKPQPEPSPSPKKPKPIKRIIDSLNKVIPWRNKDE